VQQLARRPWPGNVRELRNALERAAALGEVDPPPSMSSERLAALPPVIAPDPNEPQPPKLEVAIDPAVPFKTGKALLVGQYEQAYVEALMQVHDGNITRAARTAEIDRVYLLRLLDKFDMRATKQRR
jgi:DNA-binding NtrC family response regulator